MQGMCGRDYGRIGVARSFVNATGVGDGRRRTAIREERKWFNLTVSFFALRSNKVNRLVIGEERKNSCAYA